MTGRADQPAGDESVHLPAVVGETGLVDSSPSALRQRLSRRPREEAEARYVRARDAWTSAMKAANGGSSAALDALATAQEEYEAAVAERERWMSNGHVGSPMGPGSRPDVDTAVTQELAWRRVRNGERPLRSGSRFKGWLTGR